MLNWGFHFFKIMQAEQNGDTRGKTFLRMVTVLGMVAILEMVIILWIATFLEKIIVQSIVTILVMVTIIRDGEHHKGW